MTTSQNNGFTLIEVLAVTVIIALLAATAVPSLMKKVEKGRATATVTDINSIKKSIDIYSFDTGSLPPAMTLSRLYSDDGRVGWSGPYGSKNFSSAPNKWSGTYSIVDTSSNSDDTFSVDGITVTVPGAIGGVTRGVFLKLSNVSLTGATLVEEVVDRKKISGKNDAAFSTGNVFYSFPKKELLSLLYDDR